jgi:hypothetical protein
MLIRDAPQHKFMVRASPSTSKKFIVAPKFPILVMVHGKNQKEE